MPPKKDDKKGKKGGPSALKEIDPTIYIRKQTSLSEIKETPKEPNPALTGFVDNVENLFPEWDIEGENWAEPLPTEGQKEIVYPRNLNVTGSTNFTTMFGLEPVEVVVDPKAKPAKKEAPKKGAKEEVPEILEQLVNADGKQLPVMFKDSESEFLGTVFSRDFARNYSANQKKVLARKEEYEKEISELEANPTEESPNQINEIKEKLHRLMEHSTIDSEGPIGVEIDPYIVAAYRTVLRFAPTIIGSGATIGECSTQLDSSFLWRSIYPKLPNGKPLYNSAGKYAVKLFLAGKWRKVYVNDTMPTRADGSIAIACSSDRYELWPMILAKAIYTVYSIAGYASRFQDVEEGLTPVANFEAVDNSHPITTIPAYKIAQFVGFVVHLLVGWQPQNPIAMTNTFIHEKTKSVRLLESIVSGGVHAIEKGDIINDDAVLKNKRHFHSYADDQTIIDALKLGGDILDNGGRPILKTKKVFQQEYLDRKKKRDDIIAAILKREERIARITQLTSTQAMNEVHCVSLYNHETGEAKTFPILGIMFPESSTDLMDCKLLINWRTAPPVTIPETVVSIGGSFQPDILRECKGVMRRDDETPLPMTTPVIYEWITISHLVNAHSYAIPISTNIRTPFQATYSRHWAPLVAAAPVATNDKKAPAKGKDKNAAPTPAVPAEEVLCGDEGVAPITFMSIDTASFFAKIDAQNAIIDAQIDAKQNDETELAIKEQQKEMEKLSVSAPNSVELAPIDRPGSTQTVGSSVSGLPRKKDEILYFQVLIHADMVTKPLPEGEEATTSTSFSAHSGAPPPVSATAAGSASHPPSAGHSRPASSHGHNFSTITSAVMTKKPLPAKKELPSDIVMILEEVRTDDQVPMMFILDMKDTCFLPIMRRTFGIPQSRLSRDSPIVFWIRVFTKSSFFVNFTSVSKLEVNDAEKIWTDLGRELYVAEGDAGTTREYTEQLLFRMPLLTTATPPGELPNGEAAVEAVDDGSIGASIEASIELAPPPQLQCKTFFYINDREIEKHVVLKVLDAVSNSENSFSKLHQCLGNILNLHNDAKECNTLTGTLYPQLRGYSVHPFHWKLLIIADKGVPIVTPVKPVNEEAITQRFNGKYYANNKLSLFRDVYSIEKSSFPIAVRINLSECAKVSIDSKLDSGGPPSPIAPLSKAGSALIENPHEDDQSILTGEERIPVKDMHIVMRLYRKSDKKLVSEFRGKRLCLCYFQGIEPFLNDGEEVAAAAPTAAKGKDAKPPAKGKAAPTADTIDIIVECELDTSVEEMHMLPHLQSRFPLVFDQLYDSATLETPSIASSTIELQNGCLSVKPPTVAQFQWELDMLAGKVANISHDLSAIEKFTAAKNAWETASAGRTDRAQAALAFYQERQKIANDYAAAIAAQFELDNAGPVPDAPKTLNELTPTMIDNLVTALEGDQATITERYKRVRALPPFAEEILYLEQDQPDEQLLLAPENNDPNGFNTIHESAAERREKERLASQQRFVDICAKFVEYNAKLREETKVRVGSLAESCVADLNEMSALWAAREAYRLEAETKNASLTYMLNRSKVAIQKALESEVVVDDPKKKGKKK